MGHIFTNNVADHGLSDRLHFVAGGFFRDDLPSADVITGADCSAWMKDVGFRETRVEHLDSMVVGIE